MSEDWQSKERPETKPHEVPWGAVTSVLWALLVYLTPTYVLVQLIRSSVISFPENISATTQFAVQATLSLASLALIWLIIRLYGLKLKQGLRALRLTRPRIKDLMTAVLVYPLYFLSVIVFFLVIQIFFPQANLDQAQEIGYEGTQGLQLVVVFIGLVIIPPIVEEILFRGFLYGGLMKRFSPVIAAILVSALFGWAHQQFNVGVDTFILSLFLCYLRFKTNSLWPSILLHSLKNLVAFVLRFIIGIG